MKITYESISFDGIDNHKHFYRFSSPIKVKDVRGDYVTADTFMVSDAWGFPERLVFPIVDCDPMDRDEILSKAMGRDVKVHYIEVAGVNNWRCDQSFDGVKGYDELMDEVAGEGVVA